MRLLYSSTRGFASVADYREAARRRLAKIAFDYLDGGAEDGQTLARNRCIAESIMRRANEARYTTLLVTVDAPVHGKRDHDLHNGYRLPLPVTRKLILDLLCHPHWALQVARHGSPQLVNLAKSLGEAPDLQRQAQALARQMDRALTWRDIAWLRRHWKGRVLIKGVMTVEDARLAQQYGADGVVLSNHGGRQLEGSLAPIEILPAVVDALGTSFDLFIDSGVRRGADVVKAVALGARGVLLGRAPLYGLAARGEAGVAHVLTLLYDEMVTTMTLLGCANVEMLLERIVTVRAQSSSGARSSPTTSRLALS